VPIITQLQAQKKTTDRVSVFVDDRFFCGLSLDDVVSSGVTVGLQVDDEFLSNLLSRAGENDMYNKTLVYILRSPRTELEIRRFLSRKKDCSAEMTNRIIERLKTANYLNDEAYAKMFAASKHQKISARMIKLKLKNKGIKTDLVDSATAEIDNQEDLAKTVADKYMRYREIDDKNLQKLFRYLVSKGFEYDIVNDIVNDYKSKREIDPAVKEEYNTYQNEYKRAKEQLAQARREAWQKKMKLKAMKKKIVEDMQ